MATNAPNTPSIPSGPITGAPGTYYNYSTLATDPDGDQVKYTFNWGDGTTSQTALVNSGTPASASHSWSTAGTYLVKAMATDSKGASSGYSNTLSVLITTNRAPNTPSAPSGSTSGFAGTSYKYFALTSDPDGDQVKYTFNWGDGTTLQTALVNSGSAASAYHSWGAAGTYLVKAMATDSKGASSGYSSARSVVITNNAPSTPSTPSGPITGAPGTYYSYSTSATDPDGDQVKYTFNWGDGTTSQTALVNSGTPASASHSWSTAGTYLVKAMATDSKGASSGYSNTLSVLITTTNAPNTPSIPSGPITGAPGTYYSYSTSATDPDGDQVKYTFNWGDGTTSQTALVNSGTPASASHSWSTAGTYLVKAMATDSKGASSGYSNTLSVLITTTNAPNTPSIPSGPITGAPGTYYNYSTLATDPDGDQVKYTFNWGDGTTSQTALVNSGTPASASHSWSTAGTYLVKAMATDSKGASSGYSNTLSVLITTNRAPNTPSAPSGSTSGFAGTSYKYFALTSDPDGDQVKYTFNWGDGTTLQTALVNSGSAASAYHSWSIAGTYLVKAMATDSKGASSGYSSARSVTIINKAGDSSGAIFGTHQAKGSEEMQKDMKNEINLRQQKVDLKERKLRMRERIERRIDYLKKGKIRIASENRLKTTTPCREIRKSYCKGSFRLSIQPEKEMISRQFTHNSSSRGRAD